MQYLFPDITRLGVPSHECSQLPDEIVKHDTTIVLPCEARDKAKQQASVVVTHTQGSFQGKAPKPELELEPEPEPFVAVEPELQQVLAVEPKKLQQAVAVEEKLAAAFVAVEQKTVPASAVCTSIFCPDCGL